MRGNTIEITFLEKRGKMAKTIPLYQYDYGQRLIIKDLELPSSYEIHFANEMHGESVLEIGDSTGIDIPDSLIETGKNIYLWLFLHDGLTDGETEYSGVIPVIKRAERSEDEPTPEQQGAITTAIAALNAAVEATSADATATAADALKAEGYSSGTQNGTPVESGTYYHNNASYYAGQASTSATNAGNAQTAAETAQGKAEDAQTAAETAQGKAEDAQEAAETAQGKAEDAQEAAEAAQTAAEAAATAAESMIDDTAGAGDTDKVWSADKLVDEFGNTLTEEMLKSTTPSSRSSESIGTTSNRQYAVHPDANGKLSVNVPWNDHDFDMPTMESVGTSGGTHTITFRCNNFKFRAGGMVIVKTTNGISGISSLKFNIGGTGAITVNVKGSVTPFNMPQGTYYVYMTTSGGNNQYEMYLDGAAGRFGGMTISTAAGKGVNTTIPSSPSDSSVPTTKAVKDYVDDADSGKADKVDSATSGNFAALDSNGNLVDSGHKHSDYLTSHQDISGKLDKTDFYATEMPVSSTDSTKVSEKLTDLNGALNNKIDEPQTEGTSGQFLQTDGNGGRTWATPSGGGGGAVEDVQINGTSILDAQGVANVQTGSGLRVVSGGLTTDYASNTQIKQGTNLYYPIVPAGASATAFYGLAKAAGDSTQSSSSNSVGTYTESAKSAIASMLDAPETVSGSTPTINAKAGVRYICGEVSTLTIVVPSSGIIDVVFDSGSTATVLTVTPPTGMTMRWIGDDPTALEANKHYEINIADGCNGMVVSWT